MNIRENIHHCICNISNWFYNVVLEIKKKYPGLKATETNHAILKLQDIPHIRIREAHIDFLKVYGNLDLIPWREADQSTHSEHRYRDIASVFGRGNDDVFAMIKEAMGGPKKISRNIPGDVCFQDLVICIHILKKASKQFIENHLKAIFDEYDKDDDGSIVMEEYNQSMKKIRKQFDQKYDQQMAIKNFEKWDVDNDGKLSKEEFTKGIKQLLPPEKIKEILTGNDTRL